MSPAAPILLSPPAFVLAQAHGEHHRSRRDSPRTSPSIRAVSAHVLRRGELAFISALSPSTSRALWCIVGTFLQAPASGSWHRREPPRRLPSPTVLRVLACSPCHSLSPGPLRFENQAPQRHIAKRRRALQRRPWRAVVRALFRPAAPPPLPPDLILAIHRGIDGQNQFIPLRGSFC